MKNNAENVHDVMATKIDGVRMTLSMRFPTWPYPPDAEMLLRPIEVSAPGPRGISELRSQPSNP